jgi:hypothetical protein
VSYLAYHAISYEKVASYVRKEWKISKKKMVKEDKS